MKTWDEIRESVHTNCGTDDCCQQCDTAITERFHQKKLRWLLASHQILDMQKAI